MMFCKNCAEVLTDSDAACPSCGFAAGTGDKYCGHCGTMVTAGALVCEICGNPIQQPTQAAPAAGAAAGAVSDLFNQTNTDLNAQTPSFSQPTSGAAMEPLQAPSASNNMMQDLSTAMPDLSQTNQPQANPYAQPQNTNPFGQQPSNPFAQQQNNPFGQPQGTPYGQTPQNNPYGQPNNMNRSQPQQGYIPPVQQQNNGSVGGYQGRMSDKSKVVGGILGLLLGAFGIHNFYLGYKGKAIAQLLITLLSCFILSPVSSIWGFIEGIMILAGSIKTDGKGLPLRDD